MASANDLREVILDLMWSQWRELGVAGTVPRRHKEDCVDPEPLIAFTALHSDLDPRLRDESIDWVLRYGGYISRARLKNVIADWSELRNPLFAEYAATVNAHGGAAWPASRAKPLPFRSRARPLLEDLAAPALLSLRIRSVFGVGARAELVRAFLSRSHPAMTAAELATETAYRKRNVLNELEPLRMARVVTSFRAINADRYTLAKVQEIGALLDPLPLRYTRWLHVFAVLHAVFALVQRGTRRSDLANAADALRLIAERKELMAVAEIHPPSLPTGAPAWPAFVDWAVDYTKVVAGA